MTIITRSYLTVVVVITVGCFLKRLSYVAEICSWHHHVPMAWWPYHSFSVIGTMGLRRRPTPPWAKIAVNLDTGVPWIMCKKDDALDPVEYVHRVGRTARGEGAKGHALLFLLPEELQFLVYLRAAKVTVKEYEFDEKKVPKFAITSGETSWGELLS